MPDDNIHACYIHLAMPEPADLSQASVEHLLALATGARVDHPLVTAEVLGCSACATNRAASEPS